MASRSSCRPDLVRYSVTTCEPGASEVFTHGFGISPLAWALRATRPAATRTDGLEVLVQEVIAAITTSPWVSAKFLPATCTDVAASAAGTPRPLVRSDLKLEEISFSSTRS